MPVDVTVDIAAVIDRNRLSAFQVTVLVIVGITVIMDGFDVQAMGFVAPAIIQQWGVSRAALGPVFAAGLTGMLVGSLVLSVVADRIGRRPVLIGATLFFATAMLATGRAATLAQLEGLRFLTGLGLGAIMPNAVALAGEFSPRHRRVTLMMLVSCGLTMGAVVGGLVSALLIPLWGWPSVFYVGGLIPLAAALLMLFHLPESLQFLVLRGASAERIAASVRRIEPVLAIDGATRFVVPEVRAAGAPAVELLRAGRARVTLVLWAVNFLNLLNLYFLSNWLPTILTGAGMPASRALLLGTTLQVGGVIGTVALGPLIDRAGFVRVLVPLLLMAAVTIALIGQPALAPAALFLVVLLSGFGVVGGQPALNALAASYYPTSLRSTGVGWALGIGRVGAIVGPLLGGALIGLNWTNQSLLRTVAIPAVASALLLAVIGPAADHRTAAAQQEAIRG
jgi:AAHS family 4-hydroxybenzoate transporter-like MFS transporter